MDIFSDQVSGIVIGVLSTLVLGFIVNRIDEGYIGVRKKFKAQKELKRLIREKKFNVQVLIISQYPNIGITLIMNALLNMLGILVCLCFLGFTVVPLARDFSTLLSTTTGIKLLALLLGFFLFFSGCLWLLLKFFKDFRFHYYVAKKLENNLMDEIIKEIEEIEKQEQEDKPSE